MPMQKSSKLNQFTHNSLRALVKKSKEREKAITKTDGGNLYFTISKSGRIAWTFRYQWFGKGKNERWMRLMLSKKTSV